MPRLVFFMLCLLSLIWGGSYYFIKILLHDFGPITIAFLRSSFGLVTITMIMFIFRKPFQLKNIPWIAMTVMALINTAIPWAIIGFSETRLTSSMTAVLNATTPLWAVMVGILFFKSKINRYQILGMIVALIGLIVLLGLNPVSIISVDILGFICMLVASLFYAIGSHLSKRLSNGLSMYQITFGTLLCCMVASGSAALPIEQPSFSALLSVSNVAALIGLGVFGSGIAYIIFYFIVQKGSPEFATMVTYLIPATALIWGYVMLNEKIQLSLLTGLALILCGVFLASRRKHTTLNMNMRNKAKKADVPVR
jgi:drug/metabolite transporter (DMT)-like permease